MLNDHFTEISPTVLKLGLNKTWLIFLLHAPSGICSEANGSLGMPLGLKHFITDSGHQAFCPLKQVGYLNIFKCTLSSLSRA